ncbi:MAG: nicotinamide-nucleotide amidohydrolase family protein [Microbacteriaceae bacterium]|nr:nicotinamide-nucleotide amidohydrolase family protein [Microbacteriaceae bacterium]
MDAELAELAADIVRVATARGVTIAVAESLTGGDVVSALVGVPGASAVLRGGIVAYATELKASVLGVDTTLLAVEGAVHPDVARQMAAGARRVCGSAERPAAVGIATTGVAGPEPQDGKPVGLVYVGVSTGELPRSGAGTESSAFELSIPGDRALVRGGATKAALTALKDALGTF